MNKNRKTDNCDDNKYLLLFDVYNNGTLTKFRFGKYNLVPSNLQHDFVLFMILIVLAATRDKFLL